MVAGELNSRVTFKTKGAAVKDAGGGWSKAIESSFTLWAKVENRTGQANYSEGQRQADYDYKITVRNYASKTITTATVAEFQLKDLRINSVQNVDEGKNRWLILRCSMHGGS